MKLLARINGGVTFVVGALLLVATLSITIQIAIRFLLTRFGVNISAPWTEELCRYCITWSVFLGAGVLCRDGRLIAVDFLVHVLPVKPSMVLETFSIAMTLVFFGLTGWLGWQLFHDGFNETSPVMRIPMAYVYAAVPLGAVLAVANGLAFMVDRLSFPERPHPSEVME